MASLRSPRISICDARADRGELRLHVADREALAPARGRSSPEVARPTIAPLASNSGSLPSGSASVTPCTSTVTKRFGTPAASCCSSAVLADEVALVHAHEAVEARLERRVLARQVAAPHAIGLLHAQRFHRAHAGHADADAPRPASNRAIEQVMRVLDREVQLPAERADEIDAQQVHVRREADFRDLAGEPGEGVVVQRRVGELREHVARARAGEHEAAARGRDVARAAPSRRPAGACAGSRCRSARRRPRSRRRSAPRRAS